MNGADTKLTDDDLRAAAAAGIITEAQAARLIHLGHERAGRLARRLPDDEPFELFRGFAEIFVSVGLILLLSGAIAFAALLGSGVGIAAVMGALCWFGALYFTRKRRMALPSIVLAVGYAMAAATIIGFALSESPLARGEGVIVVVFGLLGIGAMAIYYRVFRVPFAMFLAGLFGLAVVFGLTGTMTDVQIGLMGDWNRFFDLRRGGGLAIGTLVFGLLALAAGLWFDMRDPHRIGRMARSAFWLHLLAAPALVNTVAMTAYNTGGGAGMMLTAAALVAITVLALIIDRRSFLTAGLGYLAFVVAWAMQLGQSDLSWPVLLLVLGGIVTALGTFWIGLRVALMRALPDFPGKDRLPPYDVNR
ncbi:hypothetical protein D6850_13865 [Roseovarius spongiae]|uniref:DUF2157 domain-containing protein n=1 Tax=Roseovarius spongiae TaxID=2320272 RepID=A0A3A8B4J4_9RHOB|nr:hypothetical protein [Roseovarius spongiae]RKF13387.1 hypothetical protein D6850_13865 [Roseovarius spongiae]